MRMNILKVKKEKKIKTTPYKRKARGKIYFSQEHEDAIVLYAKTDDYKLKQKLYITLIGPVFNELVDKMVFTYKFTSLPNIGELKSECKTWLTTILSKFDPNKGSKAFSYFSVITKNWFIHKVKKNAVLAKREVYLDDEIGDSLEENEEICINNTYIEDRDDQEFWKSLWIEMAQWEKEDLKPNERKVLEAIKILLENPDEIEIFNKKAIFFFLREITGLNTKKVASSLSGLRDKYKFFKKGWNNQGNGSFEKNLLSQ